MLNPDVAEEDNEPVNRILALKGLLPEMTCVSFAHMSLAKVSHLVITLTPQGVRKFSLNPEEKRTRLFVNISMTFIHILFHINLIIHLEQRCYYWSYFVFIEV